MQDKFTSGHWLSLQQFQTLKQTCNSRANIKNFLIERTVSILRFLYVSNEFSHIKMSENIGSKLVATKLIQSLSNMTFNEGIFKQIMTQGQLTFNRQQVQEIYDLISKLQDRVKP